ncbi:MAG: hypothetical protein M3N23_07460, partial [Pseudomonadota bacterium]|nr:hypothetical protein [Pseudomonadota bacterium]
MNHATSSLDLASLQRAVAQAAQSGRTVLSELESLSTLDPRALVQAIAAQFELRMVETTDMLALQPAFDLLPLSTAMQRNCVLLREGDTVAYLAELGDVAPNCVDNIVPLYVAPHRAIVAVITDAFDPDLPTWLATQARASVTLCLALPADLQAYLSKQEESARAVDTLQQGATDGRREGRSATVLSFASVSEAASPAVKLVNS